MLDCYYKTYYLFVNSLCVAGIQVNKGLLTPTSLDIKQKKERGCKRDDSANKQFLTLIHFQILSFSNIFTTGSSQT